MAINRPPIIIIIIIIDGDEDGGDDDAGKGMGWEIRSRQMRRPGRPRGGR